MKKAISIATLGSVLLAGYSLQAVADAQHRHGHDAFAEPTESHIKGKSNTTIYGKIYSSIIANDDGAETATQLASGGTRLGFRGQMPLDNGTKLVWQMESSIDLDNTGEGGHHGGNSSTLAGRDSFVGVSSSLGTVIMGKHNTPYKNSVHSWDPFNHIAGDLRSILGHVPGLSNTIDHHGNLVHIRSPNSVIYHSPTANNLNASIGYHMMDANDEEYVIDEGLITEEEIVRENRALSMSLEYNVGALTAIYAMQWQKDTDANIDHDDPTIRTDIEETQAHMVGVKYKLNQTTMNFIYETISTSDAANVDRDRGAFHLGVIHKIGNGSVRVAIAQAGEYNADDGATMLALGYFHKLSKSTNAYISHVSVDNDDEGDFGTFMTDHVGHGVDPATTSIGLIHDF